MRYHCASALCRGGRNAAGGEERDRDGTASIRLQINGGKRIFESHATARTDISFPATTFLLVNNC